MIWDKYHNWLDAQKTAGICPHCDVEVKMKPKKNETDSVTKQKGDSLQRHAIEECQNYPYGKDKRNTSD